MEDGMANEDSFFADNYREGGTGAPSFDFGGVGGGIVGTVVDTFRTVVTDPETKKPKLDKNDKELPQLNVTLQTDLRNWEGLGVDRKGNPRIPLDKDGEKLDPSEDTGLRRIYVKYQMIRAVGKALADAEAASIEAGGKLAVKQIDEEDIGRMNGLPIYEARYKAPAKDADLFAEDAKAAEKPAEKPAEESKPAAGEPPFNEPPVDPWADEPAF
jgi:hypothetical protein